MMKKEYVIYKIDYSSGLFYVGKTDNLTRRVQEHALGFVNSEVYKYKVGKNDIKHVKIIQKAPSNLDEVGKQQWLDEAERYYIHEYAKKVYNTLTNKDTDYKDYSPYRDIINTKMTNLLLY